MLLKALNVTVEQRLEALAHVRSPRALQLASPSTLLAASQPASGDLLRAMRLRRNWTQGRIASALGISQATVVHWEKGETWPAPFHLHALCYALSAHPQEIDALTHGTFAPGATLDYPLQWREYSNQDLYRIILDIVLFTEAMAPLRDLYFIATERHLWQYAHQRPVAVAVLAATYARHAYYLQMEERYFEAEEMARRAFRLIRDLPTELTFANEAKRGWHANWPCAVVVLSEQWRRRTGKKALVQAEKILRRFHSYVTDGPHRVWQGSLIARLIWETTGRAEDALAFSEETLRSGEDEGLREIEVYMRQLDHVRLLSLMGRAAEARETLATCQRFTTLPFLGDGGITEPRVALQRARYVLLKAQVAQVAGHLSEAHDALGNFWKVLPIWEGGVSTGIQNHLTDTATRFSALV